MPSSRISDARPIADDIERCLCVVMPCFNEEATISVIVEKVLASPYVLELVIVDDGSSDATLAKIRAVDDPRVRVCVQPVNLGKGAALRRGFREATAPYVIVQDADLEYDPQEYGAVLAPLLRGQADVVYGSRFASGQPRRVLYYWHSVGNKMLTTMSNMFTNLNLTDMETCYKAFRLEVLQSLEVEEDRFGFEPEITAKIAAAGWRVWEVSIAYAGRTYAEGKKITWRDGLRAGYSVVRYSRAWSRVRGRLDHAPDRTRPPAEFDDADSELDEVLASLEDATNYSDWIYSLVEPYLGELVLEIGAGHGELTERLQRGRDVTATDLSTNCIAGLRTRFADRPNVDIRHVDIAATADGRLYDSVVLINVLEHIEDDENALGKLRQSLRPGGHLCVFVPAFDGLYSDFDHRIGHRRRYRRSNLIEVFDRAGFAIVDARYINTVGALAWWLFARQLGQVPAQSWSVAIYDRLVVPVLRRAEATRSPRFGQSLLVVGTMSDS
jgi:2-polyprenyl-3-methyl-5-hydroxy-6-metoxy-1,4-benzoquinol methylase